MSEQVPAVPTEWTVLASQLDEVAAATREYVQMPRGADSVAMGDLANEQQFVALPYESPLTETVLLPMQALGASSDHLTALAGVIRTPMTVMGAFPVLRSQLVAAGSARYLASHIADTRERVRRAMNVHLDSLTERMRLVVGTSHVDYFEEAKQQRARIISAARELGWSVSKPSPDAAWPKDWWIGERPLGEGKLINRVLVPLGENNRMGEFLYRWLCSVSHVRPHGLLSLVKTEAAVSNGDGTSSVPVSMDHQTLTTLALSAVGALTVAVDECVRYYGWSPDLWRANAMPVVNDFRSTLDALSGDIAT